MLGHSYSQNKCINCKKEKIEFNYSWEEFPYKIEQSDPKTTVATIDGLKCYVENNAIYVEYTCTPAYMCTISFEIELLSSDKEEVASYAVLRDLDKNESFTTRGCLLSGTDFLSLEPGQYYPVIGYTDGLYWEEFS